METTKTIVYVAFEFEGIEPNSEAADQLMNEITESCETMRIGFNASDCWAWR
jgi:hypothetical protein